VLIEQTQSFPPTDGPQHPLAQPCRLTKAIPAVAAQGKQVSKGRG